MLQGIQLLIYIKNNMLLAGFQSRIMIGKTIKFIRGLSYNLVLDNG